MSRESDPADPQALDPVARREVVERAGPAFARAASVMARLRAPDGCPWDREQTHDSLARHLLEETYEVLEAIDAGDAAGLREELGDLVLQVLFHAQLAYEEGAFAIADVLDDLVDKLVRRHPHVFGDLELTGADEVLANWERLKRSEKDSGVMDGLPAALPALSKAEKISRRAAQVGFDFGSDEAAAGKLDEELAELREAMQQGDTAGIERELGDVLFAAAALGRRLGVESETALRRSADRFAGRFRDVEARARQAQRPLESLSADEWTEYWEQARRAHGTGDADAEV